MRQAQPVDVEPLGLWTGRVDPVRDGLRCEELEFSSRGDRVRARLMRPQQAAAPLPAVLLAHGLGGAADDATTESIAAPWAERGAAVCAVDLPLHGARADAKLRAWLESGSGSGDPLHQMLVGEFARQALSDLGRALDALLSLDDVDDERVAFAGFSLGARLGAVFCATDPRPRAAALGLAGAGGEPTDLDPALFVGRIAPRPLLLVGAERDERVPRASAEALYAAAGEPREQLWFDCVHAELPGEALKAIWGFLARELQS